MILHIGKATMEQIKVTVYLSTYNQEDYLREALDSILMQKCDFRYELLIADDCSTDHTQAIALEYQKKWPDRIITYFTPENVGGCKKLTNCIDMGLFRGEYLAYLEGDDYWLCEDRLQTLVSFLDEHPEYSRVSHKRRVIDENGRFLGYDVSDRVCGRRFTIEDFLAGENYSDFGSVFRNYFRQAGKKYHELFWASRNVCDFQDMFITQDFGPVYVMDRCFGVYRSRCIAGATNYNSIMSTERRCVDKIHIAQAVERFYGGKYDLTDRIRREQETLFLSAVENLDEGLLTTARSLTDEKTQLAILTKNLYLAKRGGKKETASFIRQHLTKSEKARMPVSMIQYTADRVHRYMNDIPYENRRRGFVNPGFDTSEEVYTQMAQKSIAFIIPYFGKLPNYFPLWLASCAQNPTVDFFVFSNDATAYSYPPNVHFVQMSFDEARTLLQAQFDFEIVLSKPYKLCDYKPVYGAAFQKWVKDYDFWGHCDIDLVWGNIRRFFTDDLLSRYDRILNQGHCSIYRNVPAMNYAFKTLDPMGCMDWRNVYTTEENLAFDEVAEHNGGGLSMIMERNGVAMYTKWVFADLHIRLKWFQTARTGRFYATDEDSHSTFFEHTKDATYLHYRLDGKLGSREVMYVHFQKRAMKIKCGLKADGSDTFLILPPGMVTESEGKLSEKQIRKTMKRNNYRYLFSELVGELGVSRLIKRAFRKLGRIVKAK